MYLIQMIIFLLIVIVPLPTKAFLEILNNAFNIFWYRRIDHWSAEIPHKTISLLVGSSSHSVKPPKLYEYQYFSLLTELLLDLLVLPSLSRRACPATTMCVCALSRLRELEKSKIRKEPTNCSSERIRSGCNSTSLYNHALISPSNIY